MKKTSFLLFFSIISFVLFGQKTYQISGNLTGFIGKTKAYLIYNETAIDSCDLINGQFHLSGKMENGPDVVYLSIVDEKSDLFTNLFVYKGHILIIGDKKQFPYDLHFSGDPINNLNDFLNKKTSLLWKKRNEITNDYVQWRNTNGASGRIKKMNDIDKKIFAIENNYISHHLNSEYALYYLFMHLNKFSKSDLRKYLQKIPKHLNNYSYSKKIKAYLEIEKLKQGDSFRVFEAIDLEGKSHKFSQFFDSKWVLLEFTSPFCGPCRSSFPELKKLNDLYASKLNIVSFVTDVNPQWINEWNKFHSKDWKTIWDKKGIDGPSPSKYSIFGTPKFYLFNEKGEIVSIIEGYGDDFFEKIKKLII